MSSIIKRNLKVGIVGCGFIGSSLKNWLEEHNKSVEVFVSDPPKGFNDSLENCDAIFVSIHIPTELDGSQDLTLLKEIISASPNCPIFVRSTVLPGTCDALTKEFGKSVFFMPEFLTQRTAYEDFSKHDMVFTGKIELLKEIFAGKKYITMTSLEAEIAKYAHNVFGALKVTYFNGIYELCQANGCNYSNVQKGVLLSGYINEMHTSVPGPDGKFGYGGKCFPKDVNAFSEICEGMPIEKLLKQLKPLNTHFRGEDL